jgi:hypothetical protein
MQIVNQKNMNYNDRSYFIKNLNTYAPNGVGVEVGVFEGVFSKEIVKNWNGTLYMVDVWNAIDVHQYNDMTNNMHKPDAYFHSMNNIKGYENRAIMIRAYSKDAAKLFNDESLDFVYIDANHSYDNVVEDLNIWFPKLKKGGVFSGHDYLKIDWYSDPNFLENGKDKHIWLDNGYAGVFGVNPAVDEFCQKHGYVLSKTDEWFGTWWIIK